MRVNRRWERALIIGASSGIGEALARRLAREGCRVALVARRAEELRRIVDEINQSAGTPMARSYAQDVRAYECVPALFQEIARDMGGLDAVVYCAGVMPRAEADVYDFAVDRLTVETNLLGAIAWLNEAAQRFARAGSGTIVGISSVAADRGRRGNRVYGASKSALDSYLESLRNNIGRRGVSVVTIKPGPVATPMTEGLGKQPLLIPADQAAGLIVRAARRGVNVAYVPGAWRWIMLVVRNVPSALFRRLNI